MRRRWLRSLPVLLAAGIGISLLIAWISLLLEDFTSVAPTGGGQAFDGRVQWTVKIARTWTAVRLTSHRESGLAWKVDQACGPPDTPRMGDERTAWASASPDGRAEWLELTYAQPLRPVAVHIYESYNPGAVVRVMLFDPAGGQWQTVWRQGDAAPLPATQPASGVHLLKLPLSRKMRSQRVRLDLNSPAVPGWNEIDAVGLQDGSGAVVWAASARGSSAYGIGSVVDGVTPVLPYWSGLHPTPPDFFNGPARAEDRVIEARGWPMAALRAEAMSTDASARLTGPIWRGLFVDTLLFAVVAAIFWWLAIYPKKFLIESARLRRGRCMRCGYDLQFNFVAGCPECGWRRE